MAVTSTATTCMRRSASGSDTTRRRILAGVECRRVLDGQHLEEHEPELDQDDTDSQLPLEEDDHVLRVADHGLHASTLVDPSVPTDVEVDVDASTEVSVYDLLSDHF